MVMSCFFLFSSSIMRAACYDIVPRQCRMAKKVPPLAELFLGPHVPRPLIPRRPPGEYPMPLTTRFPSHLPYLRRYARAVTGSQTSGDAYVAAVLEALIADVSIFPESSKDRVS